MGLWCCRDLCIKFNIKYPCPDNHGKYTSYRLKSGSICFTCDYVKQQLAKLGIKYVDL